MHVGKKHNPHICITCKVDLREEAVIKQDGMVHIEDNYLGEEAMTKVESKKYLGDIISQDMKNTLNIKEKKLLLAL